MPGLSVKHHDVLFQYNKVVLIMRHDKVQKSISAYLCRTISHIPARLDFVQSLSGLLLALFIAVHLLLEASIVISKEAMLAVTKFFEGYYFFGESYPGIISFLAAFIFTLLILHSLLALRKIPSSYRQYHIFKKHMNQFQHTDSTLWFYQALTGFMMFFLAPVHLYMMMSNPAAIGPYASSDRMVSEWLWPLYLVLLLSVVLHAAIGLYRLVLKWGVFDAAISNARENKKYRAKIKKIMLISIVLYITIGLLSLGSYILIGYEHRDNAGESYIMESP